MDTANPLFISPNELRSRLGSPTAPLVLDVRRDERFDESARMLPGAWRVAPQDVAAFAATQPPREVVVYCVHGLEIGEQASAELRAAGWRARFLQGGIDGWADGGSPTLRKRPELGVDGRGGSRWVTRERPKIDRIACPWLILRFIDPRAQFFYVPEARVFEEAARLGAVPYDIEGAPITHEWERCSFDALLAAFDLGAEPALARLATIVRGADTSRLEIAPQAAGLLALSLGLSRLHADDHAMLQSALPLYDAFFAWCRDGQGETHTWRAHVPAAA